MKILNLYIVIVALCTLVSCKHQAELNVLNCDELTSRAEAEDLMEQVNNVRLLDSEKIIENLIGEWGLIGVLPGWFGFETGQECLRLTIDSERIKLEDLNSGENSSSDWELKIFEVNGYTGFHLETNEDVWNNRMGMQIFSEDIMFGSGRVDDGNTFIYKKLK